LKKKKFLKKIKKFQFKDLEKWREIYYGNKVVLMQQGKKKKKFQIFTTEKKFENFWREKNMQRKDPTWFV
jgi:hypothetical protein